MVIEECLVGEEVSLFALCDDETALPLGAAQDHKRVGEGETGPNTGGMGAYSPTPSFPPALQQAAMDGIIRPALAEMKRRGTPFRGILYAGLMLTAEGVKLIEFNARFGDPECQALLPRLMSDLLPALQAAYDGELKNFDLRWNEVASIAVVMAARGYPEAPEHGSAIRGLDRAAALPNVLVFHAGTEADAGGHVRAVRRSRAQRVRHRRRSARRARRCVHGDSDDRLARGLLPSRHRLARAGALAARMHLAGRIGVDECHERQLVILQPSKGAFRPPLPAYEAQDLANLASRLPRFRHGGGPIR